MHEEHKGGGGEGCCLLQATLAIQMDVDMQGGFQMLPCPPAPGLLCKAHLLGKDGHNLCASLCKKEKKTLCFSAFVCAKVGTICAPASAGKKGGKYALQWS